MLFPETSITPEHPDHGDLIDVRAFIEKVSKQAGRKGLSVEFPPLVRGMIDELVDTPRTGRLSLDELEKTEKTYLGTKVEIIVRDFLGVPKGIHLDLLIDGVEVDVKNTIGKNWSIPREAINQICILIAVNESSNKCYFGLIRARREYLTDGQNQDLKHTISSDGKRNIMWLLHNQSYPANFWAQFGKHELLLFHDVANASPNERLARLFRRYQRKTVPRSAIEDVARQLDSLKRVRTNGGARSLLKREGIAVLSGNYNKEVRRKLGFGDLKNGEFVSIRPETEVERKLLATLLK
jgi:hypothetical protein